MVDEVTKKIKAQCKYDPSTLAIVQCDTFSLIRHAEKCAPKSDTKDPQQSRLSMTEITIGLQCSFLSAMKMVVCPKLPFYFAKNPWFTEYCQYLNPRYVPHGIPVEVL